MSTRSTMPKHRISPSELVQLERLSPADLKRPRKLRSQRFTDHQYKVFSLPELREIIARYLRAKNEDRGQYLIQSAYERRAKCHEIAQTLSRLPNLLSVYIAYDSYPLAPHNLISDV
ncbi:hypothetical protein BG000_006840 [Podila horticola]|nr:hypothetical protein BG000_006840 [Podila horticola]